MTDTIDKDLVKSSKSSDSQDTIKIALADAVLPILLEMMLYIIPLGFVAWFFIAWGSIWLALPIVILAGIFTLRIFKEFKNK